MNAENNSLGNILVVDDTAENLRLLANMLGEKGYEVRPVTNGRHALQAAERSAPDLVLLDINMPEMDGYEVCRRLKDNEALREIPVIFLTALTETADKLKAFGFGGVDYVSKPFQIDEVLARVKVHIALRRAQSELASNYERLRELEKMRDNLFHMIVHDMRTPLAVIMGNLDLLQMTVGDTFPPPATAKMDAAYEGVQRLTSMTNDLLDVSKMEEGKLTLTVMPCDLVELARDLVSGLSTLDRTRNVTLEQSEPVTICCDVGLIRRTLQNLLSNAIKHTPPGSAVQVTVTQAGNIARVAVIDSGRGVPLEARERIFEKFGSTASSGEGKYHSVGLGLAFCKLAVEAHGGRIGVNQRDSGGSIFWFEIPRD
jgi:two-component system sensor histidine kinase/response regulator